MKLNLGAGQHPLEGFVNLDKQNGWLFEDGLADYEDESVDAITVSHAFMYVPRGQWAAVLSEFERVLKPGGVVRITEDDTANPESERYGGWTDATTMTSPAILLTELRRAGLRAASRKPDESSFADGSLIQRWHGDPPKVFFVEGVKA